MDMTVDSFEGGITDEVVGSQLNRYVRADNLLVNRDEQLFSRPGSTLLDVSYPSAFTLQEVGGFVNFKDTDLFAMSGNTLSRKTSTVWDDLSGPSGNSAFPSGSASSRFNSFDWKSHIFISESGKSAPIKVYKNDSDTWVFTQAGLPAYEPDAVYSGDVPSNFVDLANALRTAMLAHFSNIVAYGHTVADTASPGSITASALSYGCTLGDLTTLLGQLAVAYALHIADANSPDGGIYHDRNGGSFVHGPHIALLSTVEPTTLTGAALLLNELRLKFNWHSRAFRMHDGTDEVTTAALASTEEGPLFNGGGSTPVTNIPYGMDLLIALANGLKLLLNSHYTNSSAHGTSGYSTSSFTNAVDSSNTITVDDCTDFDTLRELCAHLVLSYNAHQTDAAFPVYRMSASVLDAALTTMSGVVPSVTAPVGELTDLRVNMFVYPTAALAATNQWGYGAYITNIVFGGVLGAESATITMSGNHSTLAAANPATLDYLFSFKRWHRWQSDLEDHSTSTLNEAYTVDLVTSDYSVLFASLRDISDKLDAHALSPYYHYLVGTVNIDITNPQIPTSITEQNYLYTFLWSNEYTLSNGEVFQDRGAIYQKLYTPFVAIEDTPNSITSILAKTNESNENYPTSTMKVEIYRTISNGTSSYLVGSVGNGTTTFVDSVTDADLVTRQQLYTDGGIVERTEPPRCKFLHLVNNYAYYANIIDESGAICPNRIRQSLNSSPSASPGDFFVDLPGEVVGISSAREIPVAFTQTGCYRLSGAVTETNTGTIDVIPISENIGLLGSWSLVKIEEGLLFAGTDGFYFTDGIRLQKLTRHWNQTYQGLVSSAQKRANISGSYDKTTRRVWWAVTYEGTTVNDKCFILDLEYGLKEDSCFTTASGGASFNPTAISFWQGNLLRGHQYGYVFEHDSLLESDPKVDTSVAASTWADQVVTYDYLSTAFDAGVTRDRKKATLLLSQFGNNGNLSVQPYCVDDLGRSQKNLTPIRYRGELVWGDPQVVWGDATYVWNESGGSISEQRHFPGGAHNFMYRQIGFTNAEVLYTSSDVYGRATLNQSAKTLTLNSATLTWPNSMVDFVVALENDEYVLEFVIASHTTTVLTLTDTNGLLPVDGVYRWKIRGAPKNEVFQLLSYSMPYVQIGTNQSDAGGES